MRVYVSSTFCDLREHRAETIAALRRAGYEVHAMEDYAASDRTPVDHCLRDVASCNAFVGIYAWRYGYIPPGHDLSITELEYRHAVKKKLPIFAFLLDEKHPWPAEYVDPGEKGKRPIDRLRRELQELKVVRFFTSPLGLAADCLASLMMYEAMIERMRRWRRLGAASLLALACLAAVATAWAFRGRTVPPLALYWSGFVQQERESGWESRPFQPGAEVRDGDQFRLVVSPTADCYLCVVNVDSAGEVTVLRVGEGKSEAKRCLANRQYTIPDSGKWFTVRGRPGRELLYLVASYDPLDDVAARLTGPRPVEEEISRLLAEPVGEVRTRGGQMVTRAIAIEPDRRRATTELRDGTVASSVMEQTAGMLHVVKVIPFTHK